MKCLIVSALILVLQFSTLRADKPNFVIINIDDMGYADIEPFGSTLNRTPHLNKMADEGCKLKSFYAAPVCSPSRAALMTGCYPKRALPIPHVLFPGNDVGLNPSEITIAELLKQAGYTTGIVGKWHLGDQKEFLPLEQGFDFYYGLPYSNDMGPAGDGVKTNLGEPLPKAEPKNPQPPLVLLRDRSVIKRMLPDDQTRLVENYTREALKFIEDNKDRPFFLYLPHNAIHFPLYPGKQHQGTSQNGLVGDWIEEVDWSVGQVFDKLKQLALDDKTLVIFTSDNGGTPRSVNKPLRGHKGSTWEGGMRVPTIVRWPGKIKPQSSIDAITGMIDVMPTLVKLAGGELPTDRKIDGGDILPLLVGEPCAKSPHQAFYFFKGLTLEAVRVDNWKLHLAKEELYNLESDIGESNNVAKLHPEIVVRLRETAELMRSDLGWQDVGAGCRTLGRASNAQPIMGFDGQLRQDIQFADH